MERRIRKHIRKVRRGEVAKSSVLWRGGRGVCPCCDEPLDIWEASALQRISTRPWKASEDLVAGITEALCQRLSDKLVNGRLIMHVKCAIALVTDHKAIQSKMYFVEINGLAGPFCLAHLKNFLLRWEKPGGESGDVKIYVVTTTPEVLKRMLRSKINRRPEALDSEDPFSVDLY